MPKFAYNIFLLCNRQFYSTLLCKSPLVLTVSGSFRETPSQGNSVKGGLQEFPCRCQIVFELRLHHSIGDNNVGAIKSLKAKVCPFAAADPQQQNSDCLGEVCACYVKMRKSRLLHIGGLTVVDERFYLRYRGCGLITRIPWDPVKKEATKATSETN